MKKTLLMALSLVMLSVVASPVRADILWYNGDFNGVTGLTNGTYATETSFPTARVYDDFVVPLGMVWNVDTVWTNNLVYGNFSKADWSILTGVSAGNGGTVVASGISDVTPTPTGRKAFGMYEYTFQVTGIHVVLTPGTYWLSVAPMGDQSAYAYLTFTSGANAIGSPAGNDGNAFDYDPGFEPFIATVNIYPPLGDFSMGVGGTDPVPLPGAVWLLGSGLGLLAWGRKRLLS